LQALDADGRETPASKQKGLLANAKDGARSERRATQFHAENLFRHKRPLTVKIAVA
jgi:hypothetical protein